MLFLGPFKDHFTEKLQPKQWADSKLRGLPGFEGRQRWGFGPDSRLLSLPFTTKLANLNLLHTGILMRIPQKKICPRSSKCGGHTHSICEMRSLLGEKVWVRRWGRSLQGFSLWLCVRVLAASQEPTSVSYVLMIIGLSWPDYGLSIVKDKDVIGGFEE